MSAKCILKFLVAAMFVLCVASSLAQMPIPYGAPIALEDAKKAAAAALAVARDNKWNMAVAIVDPAGNLIYYEKMDNTQLASVNVSVDKARTAALYKRPSKTIQDMVAQGGAGLRMLRMRDATPVEGGIPLIAGGKIVGAIGVSGDTSPNDGICATAGAAVIK